MSKFIVLVEVLIGYFKENIWAKLKVLWTGGELTAFVPVLTYGNGQISASCLDRDLQNNWCKTQCMKSLKWLKIALRHT